MGTLLLINNLIWVVLFGLVWLLFRRYLPSYVNEKGKNLATKEDVEEITQKVEAVRSQFQARTEILKSQLDRMADVERIQFQWEFNVLRELWLKIQNVLKEAHWIALVSAQRLGSEAYDDSRGEQLSNLINALEVCSEVNERNKPFFHKEVYGEVSKLMKLLSALHSEASSAQQGVSAQEYWAKAEKDREQTLQSVERICEKIRERVFPEAPK